MDIENCNVPYAICMPCAEQNDPLDELFGEPIAGYSLY